MSYDKMVALLIQDKPGIENVLIDQTFQTNSDPNGHGDNSIDGHAVFAYNGHSVICEADPLQDVDPWCIMDLVVLAWLAKYGRLPLGTEAALQDEAFDIETFTEVLNDSAEFDEFVDFSHTYCCNWRMVEYDEEDDFEDEDEN